MSSRADDKDEGGWSLPWSCLPFFLGRWIGARPFFEKYTMIVVLSISLSVSVADEVQMPRGVGPHFRKEKGKGKAASVGSSESEEEVVGVP